MRVEITVPATSANMGAGFDSLGLALGMHNRVVMEPWDGVDIASLDGTQVPPDQNNLVYKTAKYLFDICGRPLSGLRIRQENAIPMARGLGSSSACIVAGLMGANCLLGSPLSREDIIHMAATMEGHPDNPTPAILGGQVTPAIENGRASHCRQELRDVSALAGLPLTTLALCENEILDLSPLASLTELETLYLGGNPAVDYSPLEGLARLKTLTVEGSVTSGTLTVDSLAFLDGLALRKLGLGLTAVRDGDWGPLTRQLALEELLLWEPGEAAVDAAASLSSLRSLTIGD